MSAKPSMIALRGLLAVAGYQNRARIGDMLANARASRGGGAVGALTPEGRLPSQRDAERFV